MAIKGILVYSIMRPLDGKDVYPHLQPSPCRERVATEFSADNRADMEYIFFLSYQPISIYNIPAF